MVEPTALVLGERLDQIKVQIESGAARQDALLGEVKDLLLSHLKDTEKAISSASTVGQAVSTAAAYATSSLTATTAPVVFTGHKCPRCGTSHGGRATHCPSCGVPLS
jgi:rubrerythrin